MEERKAQEKDLVFALDIGTRSVVGVVGEACAGKLKVLAVEMAEHGSRSMIDGQIDNIRQVGELARTVTRRLEDRLGVTLSRVCVAAAGRALRTQKGSFRLEFSEEQTIDAETIGRLEAGAVSKAEEALQTGEGAPERLFLVGYTVAQYRLDHYPLNVLLDHKGRVVEVDIVGTFLPGEVVESLYAAMHAAGLQVVSMTLEPIAAMNAAIPAELRLLNLALVDIGAGTTDIALCRDGSVVGYTMATIAGDEITEAIMRTYLVDFATAESMKRNLKEGEPTRYTDILGLENSVSYEDLTAVIQQPMEQLAQAIAQQVLEVNTTSPSALFLAGGGSKLNGLRERVARCLDMDDKRVAIAGNNFAKSAFSDQVELENPEYTTPLGIAISAALGLLNDSYVITLNGQPAKLFRSGSLTVRDVLLMNGYTYADMIGRNGRGLSVTLDGQRISMRGEPCVPAILTVNGEQSAISTVIHAGDDISFTPARAGVDVEQTLGELLGGEFYGRVLVNNREVPLDTPLQNNDEVLVLERWNAPRPAPAPAPVPPAAEIPAKEIPVKEAPVKETPAPPPPAKEAPAPPPAEKAPAPPPVEKTPMAQPPAEEVPVQETLWTPPEDRWLELSLNGQSLTLAPKADGQSYRLMDLLQYSGIDFERLDRPVRIAVNDVECGFQQTLKAHDNVTICCVES